MTTRAPLPVFLRGRQVAEILDAGFGDAAVRYLPDAFGDPAASRLSLSLPVRAEPYPMYGPGGVWVRSLLPEGRALAWAVQEFGVEEGDRFGLIEVLGADVASAAQILPHGSTPELEGTYLDATDEDLAASMADAHEAGLGLDRERRVRLSLAGMQDKVLLHRWDGRYGYPIDGAPSTLIVKPEPQGDRGRRLAGLVTNELVCTLLAHRSRLAAVHATVDRFGAIPGLVIERYDRLVRPDGTVERRHQEDLLSALGVDPLLKYERPTSQRRAPVGGFADGAEVTHRGGPSLQRLASLLAEHLGLGGLGPFIDALVFNVCIGNADAHARNHSVLLEASGEVRLAPMYDLVCTRYWHDLDADCAQLVDGVDAIDDVRVEHVEREVARWGLPRSFVARRIGRTIQSLVHGLDGATEAAVALGGDEQVAADVVALVRARVERFTAAG